MLIDDTFCVFPRTNERKKRFKQPRIFQCNLSVVLVNVEQSALRSRIDRRNLPAKR